jgi:DNA-binding transcriptional regulator PaaX
VPVAKAQRRLQLTAALALLGMGLVTQARLAHDWLVQRLEHPQTLVAMRSPENRAIPLVQRADDETAAWRSLAVLAQQTDASTRRNPRKDPATTPFGALSQWVSPAATHPIRSLHLRNADIAYTSED